MTRAPLNFNNGASAEPGQGQPLVTIICLCFNQERFVAEAIQSVLSQTYKNIELIVVDDASTDHSADVIQSHAAPHPHIRFIRHHNNTGNCKAFNHALKYARGEYLIDLAADDVLLPTRIAQGITFFTQAPAHVGVNFTDAEWINEQGQHLYTHSTRFPHNTIPQGDIYLHLIQKYFICSPTMMFRRTVINTLQGYDETLAYEDFDFWIRSSRLFHYAYTPEVLVKKRVVSTSMSKQQLSSNTQQRTTLRVCQKIMALNKTKAERRALTHRLIYEARVNLMKRNITLAYDYLKLLWKNERT